MGALAARSGMEERDPSGLTQTTVCIRDREAVVILIRTNQQARQVSLLVIAYAPYADSPGDVPDFKVLWSRWEEFLKIFLAVYPNAFQLYRTCKVRPDPDDPV